MRHFLFEVIGNGFTKGNPSDNTWSGVIVLEDTPVSMAAILEPGWKHVYAVVKADGWTRDLHLATIKELHQHGLLFDLSLEQAIEDFGPDSEYYSDLEDTPNIGVDVIRSVFIEIWNEVRDEGRQSLTDGKLMTTVYGKQ